jgi:hypothetical protein
MLIYKTFHLPLARDEAKNRLRQIKNHWRRFSGLEQFTLTHDGQLRLSVRLPFGFKAECELEELASTKPEQTLFRSNRGNVEVVGVVDFIEIRPHLTEVAVTLNYTIMENWYQTLDWLTRCVERFVGQKLEQLEALLSKKGGALGANESLGAPINGHRHM